MSRQIQEIEGLMQQLIAEHRKLIASMDAHQKAMKTMDLKLMEGTGSAQEASRLRIATLETRRRALVQQVIRSMRIADNQPTISKLADLFPQRRDALLALRNELLSHVKEVQQRTTISGKIAGAVLGHLNTVVRLVAGAVEQAGIYGKHGLPVTPARLGLMEAVG